MDLSERFAVGDLDAFETVFRQFQREVYGWIVHIVRDSAAAEDLTMETFWRIYRWRHRFDPTKPFGAPGGCAAARRFRRPDRRSGLVAHAGDLGEDTETRSTCSS